MRRQGDQEHEPDDGRDRDREEEPPRARHSGADGLLRDVRRGVVARVRPVRLEEREEERKEQRIRDRRSVRQVDDAEVVIP